jgi:hypothetical protein
VEVDWKRLADSDDREGLEAIRSKTEEATVNLRKLFDSSVAYFEHERVDSAGRRYPESSKLWNDNATWSALMFSVDEPHYYWSTFERIGSVDAQGNVRGPGLTKHLPLE